MCALSEDEFDRYATLALVVVLIIVAVSNGCGPAQSSNDELRVVQKGHFEFQGSQCRVYETATPGSIYSVLQRFSVCDPPIVGMVPGSKPAATPKEANVP